jgi:hypothetical protein
MSDLSYFSPGPTTQLTVLRWSAFVPAGIGADGGER